eukprot:3843843-Pyramimonas_sp.AAC.1
MDDLPGKIIDKHMKDQSITTGARFNALVGMQELLKGAHIAILGCYLYNGLGTTGANVEKLRHQAPLVS